ncbi:aldehyde dehydrogenase domain protein [Mycobacterium xenopi 3993]|nr:aldehyde dehydrogenase domain protein [Mycobacterium xenopi 3993]
MSTAKLPFGGSARREWAHTTALGFEEFSHRKSVLTKPTRPDLSSFIYPPYTEKAWKLARRLF